MSRTLLALVLAALVVAPVLVAEDSAARTPERSLTGVVEKVDAKSEKEGSVVLRTAGEKAGLVFIGPPPAAIAAMGNKAAAKRRMIEAGVPCVPGSEGALPEDSKEVLRIARAIGYPVIVKAAGGGGGRGMRVVHTEAALLPAVALTRTEAQAAFGAARERHEDGALDAGGVQDGQGVGGVLLLGVGGRVARAVGAAVAARVERHHPEVARQVGHLHLPDARVDDRPRRQQQDRRAAPVDLVVAAHAVALDVAGGVGLAGAHLRMIMS